MEKKSSFGTRITFIGVLVFGGMGLLQFLIFQFTASYNFGAIEDTVSLAHIERTKLAVTAEENTLMAMVRGNAIWDDMYALVESRNGSPLPKLISAKWIDDSNIDFIELRDAGRYSLWSGLRQSEGGEFLELPFGSSFKLSLPNTIPDDGYFDIVEMDTAPMIVAAMPVRDTAMNRESKGVLIFGRYLGRASIARIAERTQLSVRIGNKADARGRTMEYSTTSFFLIRGAGDTRVLEMPLSDMGLSNSIWLELTYKPLALPAAERLITQFGIAYLLTMLVSFALLLFLLKRTAIQPIKKLADHLIRTAQGEREPTLSMGKAVGRHDEIGILSDRIDYLIDVERLRAEELEFNASTDHLTRLANRRYFARHLDKEQKRIMREGKEGPDRMIAFIMCDIDFFKKYNDRYGHQEGDNCLLAVATAISNSLQRPEDLASRHGGEEFLVMLPGVDEAGALLVAERARKGVESLSIIHEGSSVLGFVTLSLGVAAERVDEGFDAEALLSKADAALYKAKERGRNRVVCAGELAPPVSPSS